MRPAMNPNPVPKALAVIATVLLAGLLATGCMRGHDGWDTDGASRAAKSDEPTDVVNVAKFGPCLPKIGVPHWKVELEEPDTARNGRPGRVGIWRFNWNSPDEGAEPDDPRVATAVVLPTVGAAEQFRDMFPKNDEVEGKLPETKANLFLLSYNDDVFPALPEAAVKGIDRCAKAATTEAAPPQFSGEKFSKCKVPRTDASGPIVEEIFARGFSCYEASKMVKQGAEGDGPWCANFGAEFSCASENICCALFALYAGSDKGEVVLRYGI